MSAASPPLAPRYSQLQRPATAAGRVTRFGWRHLARRVGRVTVLVAADAGILVIFGLLIGELHNRPWLAERSVHALGQLLPRGALTAAEFPLAVLLALVLLNVYGAADPGQVRARRVVAAALGVTLPSWSALWAGPTLLEVLVYLALVSVLALCLILGQRLVEFLLRVLTPRGRRAVRVLLVAGRHDIRRARRHPAVSDQGKFAVTAVFDPAVLRNREALESLCEAIRRCDADTILLCCGSLCNRAYEVVLDAATSMGCALVSLARTSGGAGSEPRLIWNRGAPLIVLENPATRMLQLVIKRGVDVIGATAGLFILFPLMTIIGLAIRLESPGPIFFGQRRVGTGGRPFRCYKFRSMRIDAEELLRRDPVLHTEYVRNNFKLPEGRDPRITRLGRILRRTSLDELPQLWNVVRGDMSLVGPRPVVPDELGQYGDKSRVLLSLKPGMAGAWAVSGRSRVGYPERSKIELGYVRGWRFGLDFSILWRTLPAVLARRGAH
jgi:exopolysaccharide production protein ExoY